jgi:hypothetical protein
VGLIAASIAFWSCSVFGKKGILFS